MDSDSGEAHVHVMQMRDIYLSPLGRLISWAMEMGAILRRPYMVYGYRDRASGTFRKHTRVSSHASIGDRKNVSVGDHVWIAHHAVIDGSNGVTIGEGAQIGFWCGLFSHSSHIAARLHGRDYIHVPREDRRGYIRGSVIVGEYACICTGSIILPGVTVGKGALVAGNSVVAHDVPVFAIVRGNPAQVIGDTRALDRKFWRDPSVRQSYFSPDDMERWIASRSMLKAA